MRKKTVLPLIIFIFAGLVLIPGYGKSNEVKNVSRQKSGTPGAASADSLLSEVGAWGYRGSQSTFILNSYLYVGCGRMMDILDVSNPGVPEKLGSVLLKGYVRSIQVNGNFAYTAVSNMGFQVIDVSNPSSPCIVGSLNTVGPAWDIHLDGGYAYLADYYGGLRIIDISTPSLPSEVAYLDFSHPSDAARGIYVSGGYAYIACGLKGLWIVDVSTPSSPISISFLSTIGYATDVFVEDSKAYMAISWSMNLQPRMCVVDVSVPASPVEIGSCSFGATYYENHNISVIGSYAYMTGSHGLDIFNISNPAVPVIVGSIPLSTFTTEHSIDGNYAFAACENDGMKVVDISSHTSPIEIAHVDYSGDFAYDVYVEGNFAYMVDLDSGLRIIDVSNSSNPVEVGSIDTPGNPENVYVSGNYAYVADNEGGLRIIDVSNPSSPVETSSVEYLNDSVMGVWVSGNYAYLACYSNGLRIIDISTPSSPVEVGNLYIQRGRRICVSGNYAYVGTDQKGLWVVDISEPTVPVQTGKLDTYGYMRTLFKREKYLYIANSYTGVQIIDISSPSSPVEVGVFNQLVYMQGVFVQGKYAFAAAEETGLLVIDASDPTNPEFENSMVCPEESFGIYVVGGLAYVVNGYGGLSIIDISAYAAYAMVLSPNGGENLEAQSIHNITWSSYDMDDYVKIEYSTNWGNDWTVITASTENDGTYPWLVPDTVSSYCLVRISETDGGELSDTSDNYFSILPAATINVTSPNGGESWRVGSNQFVTWTSSASVGNVKIEYSTDNGGNWTTITASTENDGSYPWTVPNTVSANCLIRVIDTDGVPSDTSNSVFSIIPIPIISVTSPNGGENWMGGSQQTITWTTDGIVANVKIEYSITNGSNWTIIRSSTQNNGSYSWTLPYTVSSLCRVRISETISSVSDTSNSIFSIIPNPIWLPEAERNILTALYNSTNGDNWTNKSGWKVAPLHTDGFSMPGTEANWYGITLSGTTQYHVTRISLSLNRLSGTLPVSLGNLSSLERLQLNGNQLTGSIPPELGNLTSLEYLYLNFNNLTGTIPGTLGNLSSLRELILEYNQLTGSIPAELENLSNLQILSLISNELTGGIPPELGNLSVLYRLNLNGNQLTGTIPAELGNLSSLAYLQLGTNLLTGSIPLELGNLSNLLSLHLSNIQLTGAIPAELGNLSSLMYLYLDNNRLTGSIPSEIGNLVRLANLQLQSNRLTGNIPSSFSNLVNLSSSLTNFDYNGLYTDDDNLRTFLNGKDADWESTQTIAPADLSAAVGSTDDAVEITWTPITFTAYTGGYLVFYSTESGGPYTLYDTTENKATSSMTVTGLTPGVTYYFIIKTQTDPHTSNLNTVESDPSEEVSAAAGYIITVTSPNGGENWDTGSVHAVTWTSEGNVGNVMIEYSSDNGRSWITITTSTENDGSYNWTIPDRPSDSCLVRVGESDRDGGPTDTCDAVFSILSPVPGSITLRSPNGGESWTAGTLEEIRWKSTGDIGYVTIEYSADNGTTWNIINKSTSNDGSYNWTLPNKVSDKCLVRVTSNDGDTDPIPSDVSNSVFSILRPTAPSLEVTAPGGGEQLEVGSRFAITWNATDTRGEAVIEYSVNNGQNWMEIISVTENDGEYDWTVPDTPSETCLVRVSEIGGQLSDVSDAVFSIVSKVSNDIVVTSPNGGENWEAGLTKEITWTASGDINYVAIEFSADNGKTWKIISQATTNDGSFNWKVPETASEKCRVRVTANDNNIDPKPSDMSDAVFTITLPAAPTIRITSPNGGEQLVVGSRFPIKWFASDSRTQAKIEYSTDSGQTWTEITGSTQNDGEYNWTVPDAPSETCLLRISEMDGQPVDICDAVFSIVPPPSTDIVVTSPNGGESWAAGSSQEITWTFNGDINNVSIELSTDNGTTWEMIVETTPNTGSYNWAVPETLSDECLVRVTANDDDMDPKPSDVCDQVFSIVSSLPVDIRVTSPNGGESFEVGSIQSITWTGSDSITDVSIDYSTDNGNTWSIIISSVGNVGTYDWTVPDRVSEECRVRVIANDGEGDPKPFDVSDSVFTILRPSSPAMRVITPNGGEQAVIGVIYKITWAAADSRAEAAIDYSTDGGQTWTAITGSTENDGDYDWLVPDEPSETCLIRISETGTQSVDISDAVFSIIVEEIEE